jgi:tetratricopeptide (TPR) repeat protein
MNETIKTIQYIFKIKGRLDKAISLYLDVEESVNDKVISSEYNSAIRLVQQAKEINDIGLQRNILSNAIGNFNKAIVLEKNNRLLMSYLGLIMCYYFIGEKKVVRQIIDEVKNIKINFPLTEKYAPIITRISFYGGAIASAVFMKKSPNSGGIVHVTEQIAKDQQQKIDDKIRNFENLKNQILNLEIQEIDIKNTLPTTDDFF